jgi:glycosyltransferase involved in cell wall biosynthesis
MARVSIVAPTYNHAKYIGRAIESVLAQTYQDWQLVISDDKSTDDTLVVARRYNDPRITLVENDTNIGITGNSWRCWRHCTGELFTCIPTDDEYEPHNLQRLVAEFDAHPDVLGVFAKAKYMDENSNLTGGEFDPYGVGFNRFQLLRTIWDQKPVFCAPAGMIRSSILHETGYFPKHLRQINDLAAYIPVLARGEIRVIPDKVVRFRWRDDGANTSAPTFEALTRFAFEMYHMLFLFRDAIKDFDTLFSIFPEAVEIADPAEVPLMDWFLAQMALRIPHATYRMFGLTLLYNMLADDEVAAILQARCGFSYPQLFKLEGEQPLIAEPNLVSEHGHYKRLSVQQDKQIAELRAEIAQLRSTNAQLDEHCQNLTAREEGMKASASWRLTAPLRRVKSLMGSPE